MLAANLLDPTIRRRAYQADAYWSMKSLLRLTATLVAGISLLLFAAAIHKIDEHFAGASDDVAWTDGLAIAPLALSALANPMIVVLHLVHRKGTAPPSYILLLADALIGAFLVPAVVFAIAGGMFWNWTTPVANDTGFVDCGFYFNMWAEECNPMAYSIGRIEIAGCVGLLILFLLHLGLFVFSAIDTVRARTARRMSISTKEAHEMPYTPELIREQFK